MHGLLWTVQEARYVASRSSDVLSECKDVLLTQGGITESIHPLQKMFGCAEEIHIDIVCNGSCLARTTVHTLLYLQPQGRRLDMIFHERIALVETPHQHA